MKVNERFIWALSVLQPKPTDNILEIGCGAGLFAQLICEELTTGKYTAVDKSAAMIKMAGKRVKKSAENGKASFHVKDFISTGFPKASFHKITAFNVNVFCNDPKKEMEMVKSYLKPNGLFFLFYQNPYELNDVIIEKAKQPLIRNGFEIIDTTLQQMKPYSAFSIVSRPACT